MPIYEPGLEDLVEMTHLEWLSLGNTHITDAGLAELKQALPNCKIRH